MTRKLNSLLCRRETSTGDGWYVTYHVSLPCMAIFSGSKTCSAKQVSCNIVKHPIKQQTTCIHTYLNGLPSKTKLCTDWMQQTASSSFE